MGKTANKALLPKSHYTVCLCEGFNFTPVDMGEGKVHHNRCPHHTDDMDWYLELLKADQAKP